MRANKWDAKRRRIIANIYMTTDGRVKILDTMGDQEEREKERHKAKSQEMEREIGDAIIWTKEFGVLIFNILFKKTSESTVEKSLMRKMLQVKPWDLMVIQDSLRPERELKEEQQLARQVLSKFCLCQGHSPLC